MKKYILISAVLLIILLSAGCNNNQPAETTIPVPSTTASQAVIKVPGDTICSPDLQRNVVNAIIAFETFSSTDCDNRNITDTEVTQQPDSENGSWIERWTVNSCGTVNIYILSFTPDKEGGAGFSVERENQ